VKALHSNRIIIRQITIKIKRNNKRTFTADLQPFRCAEYARPPGRWKM